MKNKNFELPFLGLWHFEFILGRDCASLKNLISIGFFKLLSRPAEGEMIRKSDYKGFWLRKTFRLPEIIIGYNFYK